MADLSKCDELVRAAFWMGFFAAPLLAAVVYAGVKAVNWVLDGEW